MERPNRHHVLFERPDWCKNKESRYLRSTHLLIPKTDREAHNELHADRETIVPVLGIHALRLVMREFIPEQNTMKSVDNLLHSIEFANKHYSTFSGERDLGQMAIQAIERQKYFLKNNIIE